MADHEPKDFTEHALSSKTVYRGKLLHVVEDQVRLPDGRNARREYIRHPGAVMVVPFLDRDTVLLVRQFRYPLGRHFHEVPAGKIDPGETPLEAARRELMEECGYTARQWRRLATVHTCIGYSNEAIELYVARELADGGGKPDAGEFVEVASVGLAEALRWVGEGRITDAKSIVALLWVDKYRDAWSKASPRRTPRKRRKIKASPPRTQRK